MSDPAALSPIDLLILTRLLPVGEKGETIAKIQKDLEPLLRHRWAGPVLTSRIERMVIRLVTLGLVSYRPARTRKSVPPVELTPAGREAVLRVFHLKQLPAKPKPTWGKLKHSLLMAPALGLAGPGAALSKDDAFRAVLLQRQFDLPPGAEATLKLAKAEWLRKSLGMGEKEKISLESVTTALLRRELDEGRPVEAKRVVDRLLAQRLGAGRDDVKELRDEVLRRWVDPTRGRPSETAGTTTGPAPLDLARFADRVLDAAQASPTGHYDENKVFIAHVWRALRGEAEFQGMDLPSFKRRLAEANNARLLDLSRADLVQAMDPEDVRLSEVHYLNATFHFIRIEPGRERRP